MEMDKSNKSVIMCGLKPNTTQNFKHLGCFYLINQVFSANAFIDSRGELTGHISSVDGSL